MEWAGLIRDGKFSPKWVKAFPSSRRKGLGSWVRLWLQLRMCVGEGGLGGGRVECRSHRPTCLLTRLEGVGS